MHDDERPGPLPTGNGQIDDITQGLIAVYEAVFPGRIRLELRTSYPTMAEVTYTIAEFWSN